MELCSDGHDEICYEGRKCPFCESIKTISDLEDKIYDLENEIADLKKGNQL